LPKILSEHSHLAPFLNELTRSLQETKALVEFLGRYQKKEAPLLATDGGIFELGASAELDQVLLATDEQAQWLAEFEAEQKKVTGLSHLKVRFHRAFGFTIELSASAAKNVPTHYIRKQTLVGSERFVTEELKNFESKALASQSRQKTLEYELFSQMIQKFCEQSGWFRSIIHITGLIDALLSGFALSQKPGWTTPEVNDSLVCQFEQCVHPVLFERDPKTLVANSFSFQPDSLNQQNIALITGPNMGGKSTLMRQIACNVILAQMGLSIAAKSASIGVFSSVHTRIGAHDALLEGQSTFMVEMTQLSHILHHADERSLLILDEIGRGTSTTDGLAIAYASISWIAHKLKARTLFATHYHELTQLAQSLPQTFLIHLGVDVNLESEAASGIRFLYKVLPGPCEKSFGIAVAKKAGLPEPVISYAKTILEKLATKNISAGLHPAISKLKTLKKDWHLHTTPAQAMRLVYELKQLAES
jgi:DNA mismatch repair protein MutS